VAPRFLGPVGASARVGAWEAMVTEADSTGRRRAGPEGRQPREEQEALDDLAACLLSTEPPAAAPLWRRLAAGRPTAKAAGRLLALAGPFLCGPVRVAAGSRGAHLTDASAVRGQGSVRLHAPEDELEDLADDPASEVRQREADAAVRRAAPWADEPAREAAQGCVDHWLAELAPELAEGVARDASPAFVRAFAELLPSAAASLRELTALLNAPHSGPADKEQARRALVVALGFHWLMERAHYRAMRGHLGLCLPPLLQCLDRCADAAVRLVGLGALHLMLDRAMAAEVQNFVPPLQHCFSVSTPLFFEGDDLAVSAVAPYCAGYALLLLKAPADGTACRRELADKFLTFGAIHCRATGVAFRLFLECGLLPLLRRDVMLLAPRLKSLMELLLQAAEATDAAEALLGWRALGVILSGELRPRAEHYALDLLLRAAMGYLSFIASGPPQGLGTVACADEFRSPLVKAMTAAEWDAAEKRRLALRKALEAGLRLLSDGRGAWLDELLLSLEGAKSPLGPQLHDFAAFAAATVAAS